MAHADELAARFENDDFGATESIEVDGLTGLRKAVVELSDAQKNIEIWIAQCRKQGKTWGAIGEVLGTSGEAARQKYGDPAERRPRKKSGARA